VAIFTIAKPRHSAHRDTAPATPSNPFRVSARYSASSLGLQRPANLAIGPDGNLYIPDASQRITVVSPQGKVLRRWGRPGSGPGEFDFLKHQPGAPQVSAGIAVGADGRVYVDDSGNARVEVFSPTGRFIRQFGSHGHGRRQILFSNYVAADARGAVYLVDDQKETVSKYSPSGVLDWVIGGASATGPDLIGHFHISSSSIDSHGRLLMANDDHNRILYIDSSGHEVEAFGSYWDFIDGPCDVTVDSAGNTYVNSCQEPLQSPHYTEVFDPAHRLIGKWYPSPFAFSPRFGPRGEVFALGEDGSVLRLRVARSGA
jgi:DNA-binding beta-propeller fold protein YncE